MVRSQVAMPIVTGGSGSPDYDNQTTPPKEDRFRVPSFQRSEALQNNYPLLRCYVALRLWLILSTVNGRFRSTRRELYLPHPPHHLTRLSCAKLRIRNRTRLSERENKETHAPVSKSNRIAILASISKLHFFIFPCMSLSPRYK